MAYVADLILPQHRAATFGLILCSFSVGILVGPLGGGYITPPVASILALSGLCFCILYVVLLVPESSSAESRQKVCASMLSSCQDFCQALGKVSVSTSEALLPSKKRGHPSTARRGGQSGPLGTLLGHSLTKVATRAASLWYFYWLHACTTLACHGTARSASCLSSPEYLVCCRHATYKQQCP